MIKKKQLGIIFLSAGLLLMSGLENSQAGLRLGILKAVQTKKDELKNEVAAQEAASSASSSSASSSTGTLIGTTVSAFTTGQNADLMVSGIDFNNTGGSLLFNHNAGIATDGTRLLLADRNNNRILIWNSLPTGNTPPDLVLGQSNFTTNAPGTGMGGLNWPLSVAVTTAGHVMVTDTENNRILIWTSFPTTNGQSADLVLNNDSAADKKRIEWPWSVWTNGQKMAVASTQGSRVLIWNTIPISNNQAADIMLTAQGSFGTPRTITSNGNNLSVGDHNAKMTPNGVVSSSVQTSGNFFWATFPSSDDVNFDYFMVDPADSSGGFMQGDLHSDGSLWMIGKKLYKWNTFPSTASAPNLSVGSDRSGNSAYYMNAGDGSDVKITGNRVYVSAANNNKVIGYNSMPTTEGQNPDFVVGSSQTDVNTLDAFYFITNPVPATNGTSLFVTSDFDRRLSFWSTIPTVSHATPTYVQTLDFQPWDNALYGSYLAMAGDRSIAYWSTLPTTPRSPDTTISSSLGSITFINLRGIAIDDRYWYVADQGANKIYVYSGPPSTSNATPAYTISLSYSPTRLSSNGYYLAITDTNNHLIHIHRTSSLETEYIQLGANLDVDYSVQLPQDALLTGNSFLIADTNYSRVLLWRDFSSAVSGSGPDVVLGESSLSETEPQIGRDKLYWPGTLAYDGTYLWVGEFKFSVRLLRYSP